MFSDFVSAESSLFGEVFGVRNTDDVFGMSLTAAFVSVVIKSGWVVVSVVAQELSSLWIVKIIALIHLP